VELGGLIILAKETPAPESVVPLSEDWRLDSDDERVLAGLLVVIMLDQEWVAENSHTPTSPYGLDFDL